MSLTASWRISAEALLIAACLALAACASPPRERLIFSDDFRHGLGQWHIEAEQPVHIETRHGVLDIDTPAGVTLWFKPRLLDGAVRIEFVATAVSAGGRNDQVSDLNVFWMARNADGTEPVFARPRSGRFADYHDLLTYYVGLGGNRNTTSRFRRYIGDPVTRPLRPEHDLNATETLLKPNEPQLITLIADGGHIEYRRDGQRLFVLEDTSPYVGGWFALRTTYSHLHIQDLRIYAMAKRSGIQ